MALSKRRRVLLAAALLALAVVLWRVCAPKREATLSFVRFEQYDQEFELIGSPRWRALMELRNTGSGIIIFAASGVLRAVRSDESSYSTGTIPSLFMKHFDSILMPNESTTFTIDHYQARDVCELEIEVYRLSYVERVAPQVRVWIPRFLRSSPTVIRVKSSPIPPPPEAGGSPTNALPLPRSF